MKICSTCNTQNEGGVFCSECGNNLNITKEVEVIKPLKPVIRSDYLNQYKKLTDQINTMTGVEEEFERQRIYYNNIQGQMNEAKQQYDIAISKTQMELKDVKDLQKLTWKSIKARVKGNRDDLLEKEEAEHIDAMNKQEAIRMDLENLEARVARATEQFNQIKGQFDYKQKLIQQQHEVVHLACEGVPDPVEDKIELEIKNISAQRTPVMNQKQQMNIALDNVNAARHHFQNTLHILGKAKGLADWDTFWGGGFMVDSMKHSKMADARNGLQQAYRSLQMAYNSFPQMPRIQHVELEQGSFFWDTMFDNFFSDMRQREKIQNAYRSVDYAIREINQPIQWLSNGLRQLHSQDTELYNQLVAKQNDLNRERIRMMEQALAD